MPKKLDNIREKAIAETRKILDEQGYGALAMRDIAKKCEIAVGTMYNYFPSKEYLTGCVVLEDWKVTYENMLSIAASADTIHHGLSGIYEQMYAFVIQHQYLTSFDGGNSKTPVDFHERHLVLLKQMESLLQMMEKRFGYSVEDAINTFLAESILSFSVKKYTYSQIAPAITKLLS